MKVSRPLKKWGIKAIAFLKIELTGLQTHLESGVVDDT